MPAALGPAAKAAAKAMIPVLKGLTCKGRSSCWTVAAADHAAFAEGRIGAYKAAATRDAIARAWGWTPAQVEEALTYKGVADIHVHHFVPLCRELEGETYTCDPDDEYGTGLRAASFKAFEDAVRSGAITFRLSPSVGVWHKGKRLDGSTPAFEGAGTSRGAPSAGETGAPTGSGVLLVAGAAVLLFVLAAKG